MMLSSNSFSLNLSNEDYIWPLEEDQEETTDSSGPMMLSPPLPEGACFNFEDRNTVYVHSRRPEDTPKSFELYSIPEDLALDSPFPSCEQTTFFTTKPDKSFLLDIKNSSPLNIGRMQNSRS
ncbi:hypothetical protein Gasu2_12360 [Galdieria sulphuraria]|uniref:Uncharacterized protein n=1 Tax=Galdieria sulphuraria TaxID=130081 RepID=M2W2F5_GALSU|nr:uncharacterized protein Gasu_28530 [Galdieria sulphuraria]EME29856.1 hypothetical protein Gasu_28530 [Galdieria sulphuraria]GJD06845.1 hypothetical protein Gasu2_12360 [Galdieria sulphuraria]|eukprot:XP_005706376.1 hypothetical protein Gasu_28530 [Galdieria sulphuraria]